MKKFKRIFQAFLLRIKLFGVGFAVNRLANSLFNFLICPAILWLTCNNFWESVMILSVIAACMYYSLILLYDYTKTDWLLFEAFKKVQDVGGEIKMNSILKKIVKWNSVGKLFASVLLFGWDPSLWVIYTRKGYYLYNGIPTRLMLGLFLPSAVCSTIVWLKEVNIIWLALKYLWQFFKELLTHFIF